MLYRAEIFKNEDFRKKVPTQRKIRHLVRILQPSPTNLWAKVPLEADDYHYKCAKKGRAISDPASIKLFFAETFNYTRTCEIFPS